MAFGGNSSGFSFGTATTTTATGFSFGMNSNKGSVGGFGLQKTTASSTSTVLTSSTAAPSSFNFNLNTTKTVTSSKPTGFSLVTPTVTSTSTGPPATSSIGFKLGTNLGGTSTASVSATIPTISKASSSVPSTSSIGFKLGSSKDTFSAIKASQAVTSTASVSTTTAGQGSLGIGFKLGTTSSSTASTGTISVAPTMKYCDLETKVDTWMSELEQQEKLFLNQATHVNAWNKLLVENADKITAINAEFENVELSQKRLNTELEMIKKQEEELEELLQPLEENVKQQLSSFATAVHTHHADVERERTYNLAEHIDSQLKNMTLDLKEVVEHINSTSAPSDASNPVSQIGLILSAHMDSLQWLDTNSASLHHKVQEMTKEVDHMKREHESQFRLAFN